MTFANVVSTVALFVALGGTTAWATHEVIDSSDVVDDSLRHTDLRDGLGVLTQDVRDDTFANGGLKGVDLRANTVTGADVNEGSLVGVNAARVDGLNAALINHLTSGITASPVVVLDLGGLVLRLECVNSDFFEPRLLATTTVDDAMVRSRALPDFPGVNEVESITDDDFDTGASDEKVLYDGSQGSGLINYRTAAGSNVTVQYMVDGIGTSTGGCTVSGTALQGTP